MSGPHVKLASNRKMSPPREFSLSSPPPNWVRFSKSIRPTSVLGFEAQNGYRSPLIDLNCVRFFNSSSAHPGAQPGLWVRFFNPTPSTNWVRFYNRPAQLASKRNIAPLPTTLARTGFVFSTQRDPRIGFVFTNPVVSLASKRNSRESRLQPRIGFAISNFNSFVRPTILDKDLKACRYF
jgi:hypothetical protein